MTAVRSSLVPHAILIMPLRAKKCALMIQQHWQKAVYESRSGHLFMDIVYESSFHIQAKSGLQYVGLVT